MRKIKPPLYGITVMNSHITFGFIYVVSTARSSDIFAGLTVEALSAGT